MSDHNTSPKAIHDAFRDSLLQHTDDWKTLVAEEITIKSPLVRLTGKSKFIKLYESFYKNVESNTVRKLVEHQDLIITQVSTAFKMSTKEPITMHINQWYTIREGQIQAVVIYFDASELSLVKGRVSFE